MQHNACNNNGPDHPSSSLPTALQLVSALTEEQHQHIRAFAAKRMSRLQRAPGLEHCFVGRSSDDFVHDAFQKVLLGDSHPKKGRKLSLKNRETTEAFMRCVMGIINSDLSNTVHAAEFSVQHVPLLNVDDETQGLSEVPDPGSTMREVEQRDLHRELFVRLRDVAPPELQPIVNYWEPRYFSDNCIARNGFDRRKVHQVRALAREILHTLAKESHPQSPHGIEMLL